MSIPLFLRSTKNNLVYLNELKQYVQPYWLVPQDIGNRGFLAVPANTQRHCVVVPDQNGPFEGSYITADVPSGGLMNVRINEPGANRDLMNRDILLQTIFTPVPGAQNPFVLPETLWLEARQSLLLYFTDLSGLLNSVQPVIHGRKFNLRQARAGLADKFLAKRRLQRKVTTPYFYTTDQPVTLAVGAIAQRANIQVDDAGHFVAYKITCWSQGPFEYRIIDGTSGATLSGAVYIANTQGAGIAAFPYILPEPWFIPKNRILTLEFNNLRVGLTNNIFLTITGRRIYDDQYREIV